MATGKSSVMDMCLSRLQRHKTATMVREAISALNEPRGSSIVSIRKYIESAHYVDAATSHVYIKKYVEKAVKRGELLQTDGNSWTGLFQLSKTSSVKAGNKRRKIIKASVSKFQDEEFENCVPDENTSKENKSKIQNSLLQAASQSKRKGVEGERNSTKPTSESLKLTTNIRF